MSTAALRRRTVRGAVALGVTTAVTVVVPVWVLLEWVFVAIDLAGHSLWIAAPVGLATTFLVLALPAVVWASVVAALADVGRRPVALATLRTAPPLALVVLVAVDLSQLFIDLVHAWHRLAVHVLFTVAFAIGQAIFHGVVAARVGRRVTVLRGAAPDRTGAGVARHVALAAAVGVVVAGVLALTLGWRVRPAMGWDMLKPLYLVLVTGSLGAGTVFGRHLVLVSAAGGASSGRSRPARSTRRITGPQKPLTRSREVAGACIGAAIALAWATSLRAWMTHLAIEFGDRPRLTWEGTFGAVLLPAVVVGALIGLDWQRRRHGRTAVPGVVWSPMLLVLGPALMAGDFVATLLDTGEGSGAIGVVVVGMCGGAAISARGPVWVRAMAGIPAAIGITGAMVVALYVRDQTVTASGVFGGVHLSVLMTWLALGCSLPLRPPLAPSSRGTSGVAPPEYSATDPQLEGRGVQP